MDQEQEQVFVLKLICRRIFFFYFFFSCEAQSSQSASPLLLRWWLKTITSRLFFLFFLTEIKPVACPYVLPTPSVLLQTAWLRSSPRMGQCPLIRAQQPSCPGQVSPHPGAVPSMPWLVPDWIPPSNPFQRLFFIWIRYAVWFSFPFVMRHVKGELGWL